MRTFRIAGLVTMAVLLAAGCSGSDDDDGPSPTSSPTQTSTAEADPFDNGTVAAAPVRNLADDDSCEVPLTFDLADQWSAGEVSPDLDFEMGGLLPICEIDGKPAGWLGLIRIWTGPGDDLDAAMDAFLDDQPGDVEEPESRELEIAGTDAIEINYINNLKSIDERKRERAFALLAGDGVVVVTVSGIDNEEYEGMLPAYILARQTAELTDG